MKHIRIKRDRTNYRKRLELLKSKKHRLVIRRTLKNVIAQIVKYNPNGDLIVISSNSRELIKLGWKYNRSSIPSAYLTGLILGKKAKEKNIKECIPDLGLSPSIGGSTHYAVIKGVTDAGLKINCDAKMFPSNERVSGKHIAQYLTKYKTITKDFEEIKNRVLK